MKCKVLQVVLISRSRWTQPTTVSLNPTQPNPWMDPSYTQPVSICGDGWTDTGPTHKRSLVEAASVNNHTHTRPFNGPFSGTTSRYQKGKTNLDFTEASKSEWQWHQLGHMQVCTSLQTDNHASTPPLSFLQAGCPSCRPTDSVNALKAIINDRKKS